MGKSYKFKDTKVYSTHYFSIGIEELSNQPYISIPVSNGMIETEEYYKLDEKLYKSYEQYESDLIQLARDCFDKKNDENLIYYQTLNRREFPKQNPYHFHEIQSFNNFGYIFAIGVEEKANTPYLSVFVSNGMHDYREYFKLEESLYENYESHFNEILEIVKQSVRKENDDNLIYYPTYKRREIGT